MSQRYQLIKGLQSQITTKPQALLITLIGNKGSGKNTYATTAVQLANQIAPQTPVFANTKITNAHFIPDILKWLAMKLIRKDMTYCEIHIDEASVAGLESRGSYREARALDSYLMTLSRKVNANIHLLSQLMSMIEKRAQWISDYYILCESHHREGNPLPEYFSYTIYDNNLTEVNELEIDGEDARQLIYRRFITEEIPFQDRLARDFIKYYDITEDDLALFDEVMGIQREEKPKVEQNIVYWKDKKSLTLGSKVILEQKEYLIETRAWNFDSKEYIYGLGEVV